MRRVCRDQRPFSPVSPVRDRAGSNQAKKTVYTTQRAPKSRKFACARKSNERQAAVFGNNPKIGGRVQHALYLRQTEQAILQNE